MDIAFLGDSITFGYGLDNKDKRYSTLICNDMDMTEKNYGICGTLIARAGLNRKNDDAFVSRISLIDDADIAVVFGGTNDYFWSDMPIDGASYEYFSCALETMIAHIKKHRNDKITLFVTPYPHNGIGNYFGAENWKSSSRHDTDTMNFNGHVLLDYVNAIESACAKNLIPCLNLHKNFTFDWRVHTLDGCHPNEEGHRILAEVIEKKIRTIL